MIFFSLNIEDEKFKNLKIQLYSENKNLKKKISQNSLFSIIYESRMKKIQNNNKKIEKIQSLKGNILLVKKKKENFFVFYFLFFKSLRALFYLKSEAITYFMDIFKKEIQISHTKTKKNFIILPNFQNKFVS